MPFAFAHLDESTFTWSGAAAVLGLGSLGTAAAFVGFVTLVGRVGPTRASVSVYFVPVVAIVLGSLFGGDEVTLAAVGGTGLVVLAAATCSRTRGVRRT